MPRATNTRDIALGLVVTGARAGRLAGRLALVPVRVAARTPVVGAPLRRAAQGLSADGESAREDGRHRLELAADQLMAAPEVERTVDRALGGPLADAAVDSFAEHRVAERLAARIAATPEFEDAVAAALEHEATQRLVDALDEPGPRATGAGSAPEPTRRGGDRARPASPELDRAVEQVASSPGVRAAFARQTRSFAA